MGGSSRRSFGNEARRGKKVRSCCRGTTACGLGFRVRFFRLPLAADDAVAEGLMAVTVIILAKGREYLLYEEEEVPKKYLLLLFEKKVSLFFSCVFHRQKPSL